MSTRLQMRTDASREVWERKLASLGIRSLDDVGEEWTNEEREALAVLINRFNREI